MDLKNQNGAKFQENMSAKEAVNGAVKNNEVKKEMATLGNATKTNSKPDTGEEKTGANGAEVNGNAKAETAKQEPAKSEPQAEPQNLPQAKEETKPLKIALNLEGTLKVVEDLHRRSIQRMNLIGRIQQLEDFEVNLTTENDELEENPYQGCKLIIEDDKGRRFVTTTPGLIRLVSQFIFNACHEKLAEIEAHIVLPA